jgi:hypothetical protein
MDVGDERQILSALDLLSLPERAEPAGRCPPKLRRGLAQIDRPDGPEIVECYALVVSGSAKGVSGSSSPWASVMSALTC